MAISAPWHNGATSLLYGTMDGQPMETKSVCLVAALIAIVVLAALWFLWGPLWPQAGQGPAEQPPPGQQPPSSIDLIDEQGGYEVEVVEGYLVTTDEGYRLYVRIFKPVGDGPFAAVVFVPGGLGFPIRGPARLEDRDIGVAEYGIIEVYFNAPGRGPEPYHSEGVGDKNGPRDQDALRCVVEYVKSLDYVDPENVGILSFSFGVTMAAGCVGRYPDLVKFYIDGEGPSHSVMACCDYLGASHRADTHDHLFGRYSAGFDPRPGNVAWWAQREAFRFIGNFSGAYLRLQGERGHMQPEISDDYPAKLMNNLAVLGRPWWVRINFENPVNKLYGIEEPIPDLLGPGKVGDWRPYFRRAVIEMAKLIPGEPEPIKPAQGKPLLAINHYPYNSSLPYPSPCALRVPDIAVDGSGGVYFVASLGDTGECWAARASKRHDIIQLDWVNPYFLGAYALDVLGWRILVADSSGLKLVDPSGRTLWANRSLTGLVDVALMGPDRILVARGDEAFLMTLNGHIVWRLTGLSGLRDVDAVLPDAVLLCLPDRVLLVGLNGTTLLDYPVDGPVDAEYVGGRLYVAVEDAVLVVEDGSVIATYPCSPGDVEVIGGSIFVVEGTTIRALTGPAWEFEC